ncbi:fungal-specific transcription factor domain-containing protein [Delphinella strobiligena]|nr:fungal-specific transcription factor domain-containing protein [Delphinella strobiligena]
MSISSNCNAPLVHQVPSDPTSPGSVGGPASLFGDSVGSVPPTYPANGPASQGEADDKTREQKLEQQAPSWAELKTKAGKERKRLPLACIACRRKKIRCSGEKPACKHCLRSRIPCVYKVTTRKAAPRTDYMAMLDKRLKRMEERVIKIVPKEDQGRISTIGRAVVKPAIPGLPPKPANERKRAADTAFADDLGEWSRSRPGVPRKPSDNAAAATAAAAASRAALMGADDQEDNRLLQEGTESLPSRELQLHLAEIYFDFVYGQGYHLLHKPSFIRKLEAGQVPPVLVLAVCAISARFSSHPEVRTEPAFLRGEDWASAAREIALKRYDAPNITILIVYLILGLHEFGTCQGGRSWMLGGMAQRMAYALQLHKDLDHDTTGCGKSTTTGLTFTDREIRRRTMWACFMMDRFNSSGTERPIFVNEQFIQSQLPIKEHYFEFEIPGVTENLDGIVSEDADPDSVQTTDPKDNMGVAAYKIRLVSIWGQLIRYMNLGGKERDSHPMWSEESGFAILRATIRNFRSTLPASLTWTPENLQNHASERIANQFIFLHMILNQIVLFLNRFALPNPGSRSSNVKDMPQAFVTECGRTALEAANQISVLVNEAMDYRVVAPFAGYCAFFSSTVHIYGVFSKNPALEASSKQNLAVNVKYLTKMKKHWGMFHFVTENLKDLYRKHADAAHRGPQQNHTPTGQNRQEAIFQYGDWFDRYPHGVSGTDYEEPIAEVKKEPGSDAVLGQRSDLQSVEEFFSKLGPPTKAAQKKAPKKKRTKSEAQPPQTGNGAGKENSPLVVPSPVQRPQATPPISSTMPHQMLQRQTSFNPTTPQIPFAQNLPHDIAMLQAQQQQQQQQFAGMMPQPGRDMLSSPYANIDPSQANYGNLNSAGNPFDVDLNAFNFGTGAGAGLWDQGSAWFLPFNMDPPSSMPDDSGMFSNDGGFDMTGLFGVGDFGGMGTGLDTSLAPDIPQDFDPGQEG